MTTRKRATTTRRPTTSRRRTTTSGRRRTTSGHPYRRRRTPTVASTVGTAVGMLVVTMLLEASWRVRIGRAAPAVRLGGGCPVLRARREAAPAPNSPATDTPATDTPEVPA